MIRHFYMQWKIVRQVRILANIFAVELIPFSLEFQIIGWFKVVPKAKFIEFCFIYLRTNYVEGLEVSTCDIYGSTHNLRKKPFILLSAKKFVEFDGIQGCVKKAFL